MQSFYRMKRQRRLYLASSLVHLRSKTALGCSPSVFSPNVALAHRQVHDRSSSPPAAYLSVVRSDPERAHLVGKHAYSAVDLRSHCCMCQLSLKWVYSNTTSCSQIPVVPLITLQPSRTLAVELHLAAFQDTSSSPCHIPVLAPSKPFLNTNCQPHLSWWYVWTFSIGLSKLTSSVFGPLPSKPSAYDGIHWTVHTGSICSKRDPQRSHKAF